MTPDELKRGTMRVNCARESDEVLVLSVEDDGAGLVDGVAPTHKGGGFGMKMIEGLATQIGARFEQTRTNLGSRSVVRLPITTSTLSAK